MELDDILTKKISVSFGSKDEAIEYMRFLHESLGDKFRRYEDKFFYPDAKFYDRCIEDCGNAPGDEPAVRVERYYDGFCDIGYCNSRYYSDIGYRVIPYTEIRDELLGTDSDINPANDVNLLLS